MISPLACDLQPVGYRWPSPSSSRSPNSETSTGLLDPTVFPQRVSNANPQPQRKGTDLLEVVQAHLSFLAEAPVLGTEQMLGSERGAGTQPRPWVVRDQHGRTRQWVLRSAGGPGGGPSSSWELIVLCLPSLKSMMEIFTPWKLANATNKGFYISFYRGNLPVHHYF